MEIGKIAVASHDAGGAVLLASYLHNENSNFIASTKGPATQIFRQFFEKTQNFIDIPSTNINTVITSTSGSSDHELKTLKQAKLLNIRTISIIDHWVNYKQRFSRNDGCTLPDEIWVTDRHAYNIATKTFDNLTIQLIENPYRIFLKTRHSDLSSYSPKNILYCTEPIQPFVHCAEGKTNLLYNEFDALNGFLIKFEKLASDKKIIIKTHPTEQNNKYDFIIKNFPTLKVSTSDKQDLIDELKNAYLVAGCNTMALVVASWFDIPTLNTIPIGCGPSILQIDGMTYLNSIDLREFLHEIL